MATVPENEGDPGKTATKNTTKKRGKVPKQGAKPKKSAENKIADTVVFGLIDTFNNEKNDIPLILSAGEAVKLAAQHPKFPLQLSLSSSSAPLSSTPSPLRMVCALSDQEMDAFISAQEVFLYPYMRLDEPDIDPTSCTAYQVAMLYSALHISFYSRLKSLPDHTRDLIVHCARPCIHENHNLDNHTFTKYSRAFHMYYRGSIGVKMLQGGWCLGGIIATPVGCPSRPDSGNSSNSSDTPAHGTIYSAELAYTALLIDMQLAEFPEKRLARRPFGALLIHFTPTHVRLVEAVINDPFERALTMTTYLNKPYDPLPSTLESASRAAHDWKDLLRWCLFLGKPLSEVLDGCGYDYIYFPPGLTPHYMRKKGVRTLVQQQISSRTKEVA